MRICRPLPLIVFVAAGLALALPAGAQARNTGGLPNLPGMGVVTGGTAGTRGIGGGGGGAAQPRAGGRSLPKLPGLRPAATVAPAPSPAPAAPTSAPATAGSRLPRTGAPVAGLALIGVALVSGGRLLLELKAARA